MFRDWVVNVFRGLKPADTAVYSNLISLRGRTIHETHEAKRLVHAVSCNSWIVLVPAMQSFCNN
jgi:hypothetical protein